ncbi:MAG TPA: ribonuclease R [Candidatus Cybelea sp.]|nr:ribonuclease R [Candidatus Cybelea sp.]
MSERSGRRTPLPSKQQLVEFVRANPGKVGKREIARAFHISGADRLWLKSVLKELSNAGDIALGHRRQLTPGDTLPEVALLDITGTDMDGELLAGPAEWKSDGAPPRVIMAPAGRDQPALGIGDRVLARVTPLGPKLYEGRLIRRLQAAPDEIVGVYRQSPRGEGRIQPADKRARHEFAVRREHSAGALSGEVVLAETLAGRMHGLRYAKVKERLGRIGEPRSLSLMAVHRHEIPTRFSDAALEEAEAARPAKLAKRDDLGGLPLVCIDPEDARDHDDAVFAEPDADAKNVGGWHVVVAIADVSWYVRPGSGLDRDARLRGNSVYFPDRVVPMLPEALSADLCSLVEGEPRACLAAHMWFDADGNKLRHRFVRGLMRSRATLTYAQAQDAHDGRHDAATRPLMDTVIKPLYGAYRAMQKARDKRQPLAIDLPERKVLLGEDGYIRAVVPRERFDSHRLIEEFMIQANVAAAETLEAMRQPCMYRVHEEPAVDRVEALRTFLETLDLRLAKGQRLTAAQFNRVLARVAGTPHEHLVNEVVLRAQAQAVYSPENIGHFGLHLRRYAHFTSPIRRYADLLVHRALVTGGRLGEGGLSQFDVENFEATAEIISATERRAMTAEREALDRFTAAFMSSRIGAEFGGRISGVTRFGLFVKLDETGADGLIPISTLGTEFFEHDEKRHALVGKRSGTTYQLGQRLEVRLSEADPVTGGLKFDLIGGGGASRKRAGAISGSRGKKPRNGSRGSRR